MIFLYLIRHGQAGLRHSYDSLSERGRQQARRLGEYLVSQNIEFAAAYSGALTRQRQTAEEVLDAFRQAGRSVPDILTDPNWNEFDLDQVYRDMVPVLIEKDSQFRKDYLELLRQTSDDESPVHRTWSPCDVAVVRAWTGGEYPSAGESWPEFCARVLRGLDSLTRQSFSGSVAVFTSATPIAVSVGAALGLSNGTLMRLAAVQFNSAMTTFRLREKDLMLFNFNAAPHLSESVLRTFR